MYRFEVHISSKKKKWIKSCYKLGELMNKSQNQKKNKHSEPKKKNPMRINKY